MGRAMEAGRPSPTEEQWLQYKGTIQYQFLIRNMSLEVLVNFLSCLGFIATKAQLEYKLKNWGISKNMNKSTWQYIDHKITKRKSRGKNSEVIYSGKRLKESAINRGINRHRETSIFAQIAQSNSSPASPGNPYLAICTPPDIRMEFDQWPASLPWLKFQRTFLELESNFLSLGNPRAASIVIPRRMQTTLLGLNSGCPVPQDQERDKYTHVSEIATHFGKIMPEWYEEEHLQTTQILLHCSGREAIPHYLKLIIYQISNGFLYHMRSTDSLTELCDLLIGLGILDLQIDVKRLPVDDVIIRAFMENLFQISIDWATTPEAHLRKSLDLVRWLLSSGLDPSKELGIRDRDLGFCSSKRPIEWAILAGHTELVELLLNFDVDISDSSFPEKSIIGVTLRSSQPDAIKHRIIQLLARHDNLINLDERLHAAIELRDLDAMRGILELGVNPTKALKFNHDRGPLFEETALSAAIRAGSDATDVILDHLVSLDPSKLEALLITVDTFIAAAAKGDDATILRLHDICPNIGSTRNQRGIKPVQVAVSAGHLSTCELLLHLYDGYSPALLFLAAYKEHETILRFFLCKRANVNATIDAGDCSECQRVCSRFGKHFKSQTSSAFTMLLNITKEISYHDPPVQDAYGLITLIENGARLTGGEVCQFAAWESVNTLLAALNAGGSPNERDHSGMSPLQHALDSVGVDEQYCAYSIRVQRRFRVVKTLLHHGAKLLGGELVSAIRYRDMELVSLISSYRSNLKDMDDDEISTLEAAIAFLDDHILDQVVEAYDGHYDAGALCAAAETGNLSLIDLLLNNRRRPIPSRHHVLEGTAIGLVAMSGNLTYLRRLLQHLGDASKPNFALIPVFDTYDNYEGYDPSQISLSDGQLTKFFWRQPGWYRRCLYGSPLALASVASDTSGFEELLKNGYRPDILTWINITRNESFPHLELLTKYQQRLDAFLLSPPDFGTPLFIAVDHRNKELVEYILSSGADINEYGRYRSPLQLSVELDNLELTSYLLHKGADINTPPATNGGATALQLAAIKGYLGVAHELLDRGARINVRGAKTHGRTALEGAAEYGRLDMLEFLIHHGALLTGNGRAQFIRAVRLATEARLHAAVSLLKRHGGWTNDDERRLNTGRHYSTESCCDEIHDLDTECIHDSFDSKKGTLEIRQTLSNLERTFPKYNVSREIYENIQCSDDDDDDDWVLSGE
ncbi:hypothetical protein ACHAPJ_013372 [Fusarium lateritium]